MIHHRQRNGLTRSLPLAVLTSLACFLLSAFCLLPTAFGQSAAATLSGTVEDQNGAVVVGAKVKVVNLNTGLERDAMTNESGTFTIPLLPPSTYTVRVERDGFVTIEVSDVVLNVNDERSLRIQMKVGDVKEVVNVTGEAPLINTSPAVGTTVDRTFVENLPLSGRSFNNLIAMTPGVVQTRAGATTPGQFSVNGQRSNSNYFTVDGVSANASITPSQNVSQTLGGTLPALTALGGTNNLASVDALQEFKVQTSSYAAEFGRTPGGQIQILTRSGTNDFHGSVFDYLRNDVFDANDWFANRASLRRPPIRQNDFGLVVGGPVLFPRFGEGGKQPWYNGRNKTFFFFSYEGLRLRQPQVVSNAEVPSLCLRGRGGCSAGQTAGAPALLPYLNAFPVPNGAEVRNAAGQLNGLALFSSSYSNPSTMDAISIRIDHTVNSTLSLFGRYNDAPSEFVTRARGSLSSPFSTEMDSRVLTVGSTLAVRSQIINDLRFNYTRTRGATLNFLDTFGGAIPVSDSQLFPSFASPADGQVAFLLFFANPIEVRSGRNAESFQRQINLVDTLSVVKGSHQLKFGLDYRRLAPIFGPLAYIQTPRFNNAAAVGTGIASTLSVSGRKTARPLFTNFSVFGQDSWKTTGRLTFTYGLRWEVNPPPTAADGNDAYTAIGLENPATIALAPQGTPLYKTTYNNFAPRFGLAYQLAQKPGRETVIRGGVGIFYDLGTGQTTGAYFGAQYATPTKSTPNVPYPASGSVIELPPFNAPPFTSVIAFDPDFRLPRTYQWNLAVEQSLGSNQTVSLSYVAALGRKLVSRAIFSNPNPTFTQVTLYENLATSDYHAMQFQFQRRLSRGLQALANYTWAHSIDKLSSETNIGLDRGSSDFDVRHAFSAAITYEIPFPFKGMGGAIFGNWALDTIIRAQSPTPVDLVARSFFTLSGSFINIRPDSISGVPLYIYDAAFPGGKRFNPAAFAVPPTTRQGSLGRNVLRGFPLYQTDISLRRQFNINEKVNLQLRGDVFNLFNTPNFADPANNLAAPTTFGLSSAMLGRSLSIDSTAGFNPLYQIGGPRSMQFSLKLRF